MRLFLFTILIFLTNFLCAQHEHDMEGKEKNQLPIPNKDAKFADASALYSGSNKALACQMELAAKMPLELKLAKSGIIFRLIPAGEFLMGSPNSETGRSLSEKLRKVEIKNHFYIGKFEITQSQWELVMGENPSAFSEKGNLSHVVKSIKTENFPVENISWEDCQKFIYNLHLLEGLKNGSFCLPNEQQWEYACRAGTMSKYFTGQNNSSLNLAGWFYENAGKDPLKEPVDPINTLNNYNRPHEVGKKHQNAFGIFDTHGNVWEWCSDLYSRTRSARVVRGGSWNLDSNFIRSAKRLPYTGNKSHPSIGLRLVLNTDFSAGIPNQILEVDSKLWPKKFQQRTPKMQIAAVSEHGITQQSRNSVLSALHWLKSVQKPDGSWGTSAKSAFTGKALLCFLANGHTPKSAEFGDCVNKAMLWLANDRIDTKSLHAYAHGIKTLALAEAYGMTGNQKIKVALEKCLSIILDGFRPEGSFNYNYDIKSERNDLSFASWNYAAMNAALNARISHPKLKPTIQQSIEWLKSATTGKYNFPYATTGGEFKEAESKHTMRAAGTSTLQAFGEGDFPELQNDLKEIAYSDILNLRWQDPIKECLYGWYYATQAMYNLGGKPWASWHGRIQSMLVRAQNKEGYWQYPGDYHGGNVGDETTQKVYATAFCVLMLSTPYRYAKPTKLFQE